MAPSLGTGASAGAERSAQPANDSTGSRPAQPAAASARRSPGSVRAPGPRAAVVARAGDPARDVDEEAAPGAAAGRRLRWPSRGRGPARRRRPGRRRPARAWPARARCVRIAAQLGRCGRADDEADGPARPPAAARRATRAQSGSAGAPVAASARDDEVLELARARVRRPAQDVGEAVGALEQRGDRLRAEVRAHRHRVGTEPVEEGDRLAGGRRADVAALGVGDDRQRRPGSRARSRSRAASPSAPNASKNARLGLTAAAYGPAASSSEPGERLDAAAGRGLKPSRERGRIGVEAQAEDAADRGGARRQPLEIRRRHAYGALGAGGRRCRSARPDGGGSWSGGMYQSGCDAPSRPALTVSGGPAPTRSSGRACRSG